MRWFPPTSIGLVVGAALVGGPWVARSAPAQEAAAPPLARYVPAEGLAILVEHDGLATRPKAWEATATSRMLRETTLGAMLEDVAVQAIDGRLIPMTRGQFTGREVVGLLKHLALQGFAIGYCGALDPPQPSAAVLVIRGAEGNPTFRKALQMIPPVNEPAARKVEQGKRTVYLLDGPPVRWWFEKGDFVVSFAPPDGPDPVADALDGKSKSAVDHPARVALAQPDAGDVPIGRLFVDVKALPPVPPDAAKVGLDAVTRVDARWSIRGPALSTSLAVQAPRPRRGLLALFDQPAITPGTVLNLPPGQTDATLMAIDFRQTGRALLALMAQSDPGAAARSKAALDGFRQRTGLSFDDDLMGKLGPRLAIASSGGGSLFGLGILFNPPDVGAVIEVRDAAKFADNLDKLMDYANRELKAAGSAIPAPPGPKLSPRPGTSYAEFRKLKGAERGYTLAIPVGVAPTPAGIRPTVIIDTAKGLLAVGGTPATARRALATLVLKGTTPSSGSPTALAKSERRDEFARVTVDPSDSLPGLLVNIPAVAQTIAVMASQSQGPTGPRPTPPAFRLAIDPDAIPDAGALRPYLFPTRVALASDDATIRLTVDAAFPVPTVSLSSGAEVPVLIALLLPAVQAAREAARRSQCVNNCKQIGLAMHNYASVNDHFPPATIRSKDGKPLLSWRVALLPYLEQAPLYNAFHLDEPWDSEHNKPLSAMMPNVFSCPSHPPTEPGLTDYRVFTNPGTLFDPANKEGPSLAQILDGTSNTIMVVEASGDPTIWTKPEEFTADQETCRSLHPGGFNTLFADGSVKFLKRTISRAVFQALTTKAGGEVISADSY